MKSIAQKRIYFFLILIICYFNYMGQSVAFSYVRSQFGVSSEDALWLLRGFHAAAIITSIVGIVIIKWVGNKWLFICSAFIFLIATIISIYTNSFSILLCARITAGFANGFMQAVAGLLFIATYQGKEKPLGSIISLAATIVGICLSLAINSSFLEDFGWRFTYVLSVPIMSTVFLSAFFFIPVREQKESIEVDWLSIFPFAILIFSMLYTVMYWDAFGGLSSIYITSSISIFIISATILFIRGFTHTNPIFDTTLFKYPSFIAAFFISFLSGVVFVFNFNMIAKLLGGILQMSFSDILVFISLLALLLFVSILLGVILLAKKVNAFWMMIAGLLCIAFACNQFSQLNTQFYINNIITPSLVCMLGAAFIALSVIIVAMKSVPPEKIAKVGNFRSVLFLLGIAIAAVDLTRIIDYRRVANFNAMIRYTNAGDSVFNQRLSGFKAFYLSKGYDPDSAYQAAIKAMTGTFQLQAFFKGMMQTFHIASIICIAFACLIFLLWLINNLQWIANKFQIQHSKMHNHV